MSYISAADFRAASVAEYCMDIKLSAAEADDTLLAAVIARQQARLEDLTFDVFSSSTLTFDLNGYGRETLVLPMRCTAITTVKTRDLNGTLTTQDASVYRLVSSLDAAGAVRIGQIDRLAIVPGKFIAQVPYWSPQYVWPWGEETIQVTGTFGWTTCPSEIRRALALLVYQHVKPVGALMRNATTYATSDAVYGVSPLLPEAQDIVTRWTRPELSFA